MYALTFLILFVPALRDLRLDTKRTNPDSDRDNHTPAFLPGLRTDDNEYDFIPND
jgi:hypothetical protein